MASQTVAVRPRSSQFPVRQSSTEIPQTFDEAIADGWRMVDEERTGRRSGTVILEKDGVRLSASYVPTGRVGIHFSKPEVLN